MNSHIAVGPVTSNACSYPRLAPRTSKSGRIWRKTSIVARRNADLTAFVDVAAEKKVAQQPVGTIRGERGCGWAGRWRGGKNRKGA